MRVLAILLMVILKIVLLPLTLLDYLILKLPTELRARKWRKTLAVGDRAYFINILGSRTEGTISHIYDGDEVRLEQYGGSSTPLSRDSLYPMGGTHE